ncbi:MAG: serine/threonine protein kinase [Polyangiaceae bacterium]|nr:serine/threonine protein kinase [Polyangiaceae bacterium]
MGIVWAAADETSGQRVALKLLRPGVAESATGRRRFLREARAIAAVRHPNVVAIHDVVGLDDGTPVLVMDLLQGESLRDRLSRDDVIALPELARILLPAVSAVGTAHSRGIVHRDLKPDNIFIAAGVPDDQRIKVLDFGIAKLTASEGEAAATGAITHTGALLGTPYYMSPEQILGERDIDHRADIWSIGVILYECLTGARPTEGDSVGKVLKRIITGSIAPIRNIAPYLPDDICSLIDRSLSTERHRRPAGLHEVARVLERYGRTAYLPFGPPAPPTSQPGLPAPPAGSSRRAADALELGPTSARALELLATLPAGTPPSMARGPGKRISLPPAATAPTQRPPPPAGASPGAIHTPIHTPPGLSTPAPADPASPASAPAPIAAPGARRARRRLVAAAVIGLVAAAIAAAAVVKGGSSPSAPHAAPSVPTAKPITGPASGGAALPSRCPAGMVLVHGAAIQTASDAGEDDDRTVHGRADAGVRCVPADAGL